MTPFGTTPFSYDTVANCKVILAEHSHRNRIGMSWRFLFMWCWWLITTVGCPGGWLTCQLQPGLKVPLRRPTSQSINFLSGCHQAAIWRLTRALSHWAIQLSGHAAGLPWGARVTRNQCVIIPKRLPGYLSCSKELNQYEAQSILRL